MFILPLDSPSATLENSGGKGMSLARLARRGFRVPPGFLITTAAYQSFVEANGLSADITRCLADLPPDDVQALEAASARIRSRFSAGEIPADLAQSIHAAYSGIGAPPVAVRSSATAEDLPDLSFAGQQDTYLNIIGQTAVLKAVVDCWSSLWTARAIGYRTRSEISHADVALAVVVQEMVNSEVSGVLFTANPLTGLLSESVIDATFGLGEALVSGQVEPDHFVVDALGGEILKRELGAKKVATRPSLAGGVETRTQDSASQQTLSDQQILDLAVLGREVQWEYGAPQDIEWALADGQLFLLQSRPITSLFPIPDISFDPLQVWFSFGSVQGVLGPITPLGRDGIRGLIGGAASMFGVPIKAEENTVFEEAGERLWIRVSDVMRNPMGRKIMGFFIEYIDPSAARIFKMLIEDPRLEAEKGKLKFSTLRRISGFAWTILSRMPGNFLRPERARARFDAKIDEALSEARVLPGADRFEKLANTVAFFRAGVGSAFPLILPIFIPMFGPSMGALNLLNKIAGKDASLALEVTRGLPRNVTTEMDLALWSTAQAVRQDSEALRVFSASSAAVLSESYLGGALPPAAQNAVAQFMERYGMRGIAEIDLGQPRWREDPDPVMHTLKSYLQIEPEMAPDIIFRRGQEAAEAAIEKLAGLARRQHGGPIKERLVRAAARRIRVLMGVRESPKFFAICMMGIGRKALLEAGQEFAAAGEIAHPTDLGFLRLAELEALSRREPPATEPPSTWKAIIAERRAAHARELRRRQIPRVLVSDGRAFYEGVGARTDSATGISGSPVSPGVAEGLVRIVLDPHTTRLLPGEILVCPGTDPAWTPLFLSAAGLITEVGGMMTHGSVVAREYGIPAVVGVHQATQRLHTGQRIRLDGSTGQITILPG